MSTASWTCVQYVHRSPVWLHWLILPSMNLWQCVPLQHDRQLQLFHVLKLSTSVPALLQGPEGHNPHVWFDEGDILTPQVRDGGLSRVRRRTFLLLRPPVPNIGAAIWRTVLNFYASQGVCLNCYHHIYQKLLNFTYAFKCYHQKM